MQKYWEVAEFDQLLAKIREIIPADHDEEQDQTTTDTNAIKQVEGNENSEQENNETISNESDIKFAANGYDNSGFDDGYTESTSL